jgi:L-arabinokinase
VLRTAVSADLLKRTVRVPYTLEAGPCDTGIIQATSISHDDAATVRAAVEFYRTYSARVADEVARLARHDVGLVVGDIPPLAFSTAARLGVPSVAIGNFTWDWIYETHPGFLPDGQRALACIREAHSHVSLALELPFSGGFDVFRTVEPLPLVARRATGGRAETRAFFGLPATAPVALLSFGGYGLPSLDLAAIDCGREWTIATTDRVTNDTRPLPPYVRVIGEQSFLGSPFRYEDLVAAADVIVTKPGYGIIAECVSTGTAMLYTSRGDFREYDVLVSALPDRVRARYISQTDLFAGRWREALEAVRSLPEPSVRMATNGAEVAARRLADMIERRSAVGNRG